MFVGRQRQLAILNELLEQASRSDDVKPGRALLMRGRRRVGKSRLVEEFIEQSNVPSLYFAATGRPIADELALFTDEGASSNLPGRRVFSDVTVSSWDAALHQLALALPDDRPSVVVFDELPYLVTADPHFEGSLQRAFDRELSRKPVLIIGIGSDISMMEALNEYNRPFHQRASEIIIPPLSPAEIGEMIGLPAAEAFDAALITGGLPLIASRWKRGVGVSQFLKQSIENPTSPLLVSAERSLAAEFPSEAQARTVLLAIGSGERTFTNIGQAAGGISGSSLTRALEMLIAKRIVAVDVPLSTRPSRDKRYRLADPYLRFWLAFLGPYMEEIERGRSSRVLKRIENSWTSWRGRAIEPIIRDAIAGIDVAEITENDNQPSAVGGYWTRNNDPELDLVIADREPVAKQITAIGSIKWLENSSFDRHDFNSLVANAQKVLGATAATPLFAVSRHGSTVDAIPTLAPDDLLEAYR